MATVAPDTLSPPDPGLTAAQVAERVAAGEVNAVENVTSRPLIEIIKTNVFTRFNGLLGMLMVMVMLTGRFLDGIFGVAALINSIFGIAQELTAKRKLDSLAVLNAPTIHVVRDGVTESIPTGDVVKGDVVELRSGDQVPADGTVIGDQGLEIDESNLTGESDPMPKAVGDEVASGTVVVAGRGWFRADVVGAATQANRLSAQARKFTRAHSDVQHSINILLRWLTWIVIVAIPVVFFNQWRADGENLAQWREIIVRAAAALVGLIPEGLVLLTTLAFVTATIRLSRRKALVQELPAVEGLARVDVICLDKTGTLTEGEIAYDRLEPVRPDLVAVAERALGALAHGPNPNGTTKALAAAFTSPDWRMTGEIPFNSARKWSAASYADHGTWVLGAPDVLIAHCEPSGAGGLDVAARVRELADTGDRVVLLARADELPDAAGPSGLTAYALVVLTEQVRPDAAATLAYFKEQGVTVKVISGDNPDTVAAVVRRLDVDPGTPVDARTLPTDDPEKLRQIVEDTTVFGRVTPDQKQAIVKSLQEQGHVVAMTGDGVNDVLALKDADIGIAMGNAAPATKAVAQIVLLDGRFSNMPAILAEGRRVIANVERVANLFVTKNVMSAVIIVATTVVGLSFPFLPRQLTLLSTFAIGIPAMILALAPNAQRYQPGFLKRVLALAIPSGIAAGAVSFLAYSDAVSFGDMDPLERSVSALVALLVTFFALLLALARPYAVWKLALVGAMVACVSLAFVTPIGNQLFQIRVTTESILDGLIFGVVGVIVVEIAYRWSQRLRREQPPPPQPGAGTAP
ncbi:putative cation-transporting ATPase [Kineosphaera limosa NBRC 100340]|uniref:Putative cation-transporting ATPase n=1 Tax=Kineosphaera limosa NBRC 100340 TaxID=1184609 RepID=K6WBJ7_9MICO|nr:putative cation-transporting ATPase [Kineosphaera limosa NBRC 100340]